jgi:cysteine synthase
VFISGVGTGGTLTGVSRYIKGTKGKKDLITVAVEPTDSRLSPRRWRAKSSNRARTKFRVSAQASFRATWI